MKTFETTWRNKWLTADAATIDDMISTFEATAQHFREMKAAGITLDPAGGTGDDYARLRLITTNSVAAEKYGLEEFDDDDEDDVEE